MSLVNSLCKVPLLLGIIWANYTVYTSPTPFVTEKASAVPSSAGYVTRNMRPPWMRTLSKAVMRSAVLVEVFAIAATLLPADIFASLPFEVATREVCTRIRLTPSFAIGWILLMAGALLRRACYREMGKHFTFEITIHKDHRLVTSGPYSFVRHPSYLAVCMVAAGSMLCFFGSGSWFMECGALGSGIGQAFGFLWVVDMAFVPAVMLLSRVKIEDGMLKNTFGKEWEKWAKQTPYAVIPGVF